MKLLKPGKDGVFKGYWLLVWLFSHVVNSAILVNNIVSSFRNCTPEAYLRIPDEYH